MGRVRAAPVYTASRWKEAARVSPPEQKPDTGDNGRLLRGRGLAANTGPTTQVQRDVRESQDFIRGPSV